MDSNTDKQPEAGRRVHGAQVVTGAIIITLGIVMFLDRTAILGGHALARLPWIRPDCPRAGRPEQRDYGLRRTPQQPAIGGVADLRRLVAVGESDEPVRSDLREFVAADDRRWWPDHCAERAVSRTARTREGKELTWPHRFAIRTGWSPGDGQVARSRPRFTPQALFGVIVIILGILFTLDNLNVIDATDYLQYWPAGLIAVGLLKLWQVRAGQGVVGGLFLVGLGSWMLLERIVAIQIRIHDVWPLFFVFLGGYMVWKGAWGTRQPAHPRQQRAGERTGHHGGRRAQQQFTGVRRRRPDRDHGRVRNRSATGLDQR